jgi:hypothetical protein
VKSLTNYPEVVQWMDENLHWTRQVGEVFAAQPADVMQAIQRLRAKARAAGTLVDTPQQQIIAEPQVIRIVPAQPDVIYVPHYEPEVVFVDRPYYYTRPYYYGSPFLTFGIGVPVGSWLAFDCDWRSNSIWAGNRHRRWTGHDWRRPVVAFAPSHNHTHVPGVRQWRPAPHVVRPPVVAGNRFRSEIARPVPFGLASSNLSASSFTRRSDFSSNPVAPAVSRNSTRSYRQESTGQRPSAPVVAPPLPGARAPATTAPPNIQPLPQARRSGTDGGRDFHRPGNSTIRDNSNPSPFDGVRDYSNRAGGDGIRDNSNRSGNDGVGDYGNRSRNFRNQSQSGVTAAPPSVAPAVPMSVPSGGADRMGPSPHRSYSRSSSSAAIAAPQVQARSAPPPAVVNPVAPQAAPQAAPAAPQSAPSQRSGGGNSRGHRGANNQPM